MTETLPSPANHPLACFSFVASPNYQIWPLPLKYSDIWISQYSLHTTSERPGIYVTLLGANCYFSDPCHVQYCENYCDTPSWVLPSTCPVNEMTLGLFSRCLPSTVTSTLTTASWGRCSWTTTHLDESFLAKTLLHNHSFRVVSTCRPWGTPPAPAWPAGWRGWPPPDTSGGCSLPPGPAPPSGRRTAGPQTRSAPGLDSGLSLAHFSKRTLNLNGFEFCFRGLFV